MSKQRYSAVLHKETAKVEDEMKALGAALLAERARMVAVRDQLEKNLDLIDAEMPKVRNKLKGMIEKPGIEDDPEYQKLKERYFDLIYKKSQTEEALMVAEEAIAEADTLHPGGIPHYTGPLGRSE